MLSRAKRRDPDKIAGLVPAVELFLQNGIPAGTAGAGRPRQTENQGLVRQTGQAAGLEGRRTDFIIGHLPEQLSEALDNLVE